MQWFLAFPSDALRVLFRRFDILPWRPCLASSATLLSLFSYFDPHLQAFPAFSLEEAGGFTEKDGEDLPVPSLRSSCARGGEFRQIPLGIWLSEGRSSLERRINLLHLLSE